MCPHINEHVRRREKTPRLLEGILSLGFQFTTHVGSRKSFASRLLESTHVGSGKPFGPRLLDGILFLEVPCTHVGSRRSFAYRLLENTHFGSGKSFGPKLLEGILFLHEQFHIMRHKDKRDLPPFSYNVGAARRLILQQQRVTKHTLLHVT